MEASYVLLDDGGGRGTFTPAVDRKDEIKRRRKMNYHGTSTACGLGVLSSLMPPDASGWISEKGRVKNTDRVFFTRDLAYARIYAGRACNRFGGEPVVFVVHSIGEVVCLSDRQGCSVYHAPKCMIDAVL